MPEAGPDRRHSELSRSVILYVGRVDAGRRGKLAGFFLKIGRGLDERDGYLWVGSRLCHLEQGGGGLPCVEAILEHDYGSPRRLLHKRKNADSVPQRKYKGVQKARYVGTTSKRLARSPRAPIFPSLGLLAPSPRLFNRLSADATVRSEDLSRSGLCCRD